MPTPISQLGSLASSALSKTGTSTAGGRGKIVTVGGRPYKLVSPTARIARRRKNVRRLTKVESEMLRAQTDQTKAMTALLWAKVARD